MKQLTPAQEQEIRRSAGKESPQALAKRLGLSRKRVEQALSEATRPAARPAGGREPAALILGLGALLVLILGWVAHAPGLEGRDWHFDDGHAVRDNVAIKTLHRKVELETRTDLGGVQRLARWLWALGPTAGEIYQKNPYRQVTNWSFTLTYLAHPFDQPLEPGRALQPEDVAARLRGWHAANLRIHLLNALLVGWVAWLTLTAPALRGPRGVRHPAAAAVACALLFATHPLAIQAVAYLSQRAESLCATFYLLALGLHVTARLRALEGPRRGSAPWLTPLVLAGAGALVVVLAALGLKTGLIGGGGLVGAAALVGLGTVGALVALIKSGRDEPVHAACQAGCFLAFGLGLQTKELAATLPLAIVTWDLLFVPAALVAPGATPPPGRWWALRALRTGVRERALGIGVWVLAIAGGALVPVALGSWENLTGQLFARNVEEGGRALGATVSAPGYLLTQQNVLATYLRLFLLPVGQNIDHDYPVVELSPGDGHLWLALLSGLLWLSALGLALRRGDRARLAAFALLFAGIVLSITSSVIVLPDVIYEHRAYLPLFAASLLLAGLLELLVRRWVPPAQGTPAVLLLALLLALALTGLSRARNRVWETEVTLWRDASEKAPGKPRPWTNYGLALMNTEELAITYVGPDKKTYRVRGSALDLPEGLKVVYPVSAPEVQPVLVPGPSLVKVEPLGGGPEKARAAFRRALEHDPKYTKALNNLALVALAQGGARRFEGDLLRQGADVAAGQGNAARAQAWREQAARSEEAALAFFHEAEGCFVTSLSVRPDDAILLSNLGNLYLMHLEDDAHGLPLLDRAWQVPQGPAVAMVTVGEIYLCQALEAWEAAKAAGKGEEEARAAARPLWELARARYRGYLESRECADPHRGVARERLGGVERVLRDASLDPKTITPQRQRRTRRR